MPFKVVTMWCLFSWTQFLWGPDLQIVLLSFFKTTKQLRLITSTFSGDIFFIVSLAWVALTGKLLAIVEVSIPLAKATAAPVQALPIQPYLGLEAVADQLISGICGGSSQFSWWWVWIASYLLVDGAQYFEEHSFLSQNNVVLCLANRHSLVHPFLDVSLWVAGRLHISSSGSTSSHHFPSSVVLCTINWS